MKLVSRTLFAAATLLLTQISYGQFCPPGQYPVVGQGWNYCAPVNNQQAPVDSAPPTPLWKSRWQSIAADIPKGILGTSIDQASSETAEKAAIADCKAKGGTGCEVQVTTGNGCVAMIVGDSRLNTQSGDSKAEVETKGLTTCAKDDHDCRVYYSACSMAKRIQ